MMLDETSADPTPGKILVEKQNRQDASFKNGFSIERYKAIGDEKISEWSFNRGKLDSQDNKPDMCLALSGGGIRSAALSICAMMELSKISWPNPDSKTSVMDHVDIISSVSGGGYALTWYYLQKYYQDQKYPTIPEQNVLSGDQNNPYQQHLVDNGNYLVHKDDFVGITAEVLGKLSTVPASLPAHIISNLIMDWDLNLSPIQWFYENGLEREFTLVPRVDGKKGSERHINAWYALGVVGGANDSVLFNELGNYALKEKLPYFIVNTTARVTGKDGDLDTDFRNRIYEFTPLWSGSDYFGYRNGSPIDVQRAMAVSGAAIDGAFTDAFWGKVIDLANLDLGVYIDNPNVNSRTRTIHNILPFPLYLLEGNSQDINDVNIYLSDGGHSEDLGLYSLVRRGCEKIIMIDGTLDPNYEFSAQKTLKNFMVNHINDQNKVLSFDLDQISNASNICNDSTCIMNGTIGWVKAEDKMVDNPDIKVDQILSRIIYFKPALDETLNPNNNSLDKLVEEEFSHIRTYAKDSDIFPQQTTADQFFSDNQFKAYRDLARYMIRRYFRKTDDRSN